MIKGLFFDVVIFRDLSQPNLLNKESLHHFISISVYSFNMFQLRLVRSQGQTLPAQASGA